MTVINRSYDRALAALHAGDVRLCAATASIILQGDFAFGPAHLLRAVSLPADEILLAAASYRAACRYSSLDAEAWFNHGVAAESAGLREEAIDCYRRAHRLAPNHMGTLINGAQLLRVTEHFEEAVAMARKLQKLAPDNPAGYANEAVALIYLGDLKGSDEAFAKAISLSPDPSLLRWEQHHSLLARRRFQEAWLNYESRFNCGSVVGVDAMAFDLPIWDGAKKSHVIAYGEQGLGDQIMFASMLAELERDSDKVSLAVSPLLVDLFAASFPTMAVYGVANGRDPHECAKVAASAGKKKKVDAVMPLGSLMTRYRNEAKSFTGQPYLSPSASSRDHWVEKLGKRGKNGSAYPLRIGLCWASNPAPDRFFSARRAKHKTMPLGMLAPLVATYPTAEFVAVTNVPLDRFEGSEEFAGRIIDVSDDLTNLDRTAALLENLDLLITVDTGVAHLAGALGIPVWILLHQSGDPRWGQNGDSESYWYKSARLFWQERLGDWAELVARVSGQLEKLAADGLQAEFSA